jgi:heme/copper-type cytochrome/quinol oxidase subunit 2
MSRLESAVLLVAIMLLGSLALWFGVPLGWLWVGSRIQGGTNSVELALGAMMIGMVLTIAALVLFLARLNRAHVELQARRGRAIRGATALERVLVASAAAAVVGFGVWFFGFSGSEPIPLQIGY